MGLREGASRRESEERVLAAADAMVDDNEMLVPDRDLLFELRQAVRELRGSGSGVGARVALPVPALAPTWVPGDNSLMPAACPVCGSVGTARYMPEHLIEEHRP